MNDLWISPRDLDAGGSSRELPVYTGEFNSRGEPLIGHPHPTIIGWATAHVGRVTYQGCKYLTVNLQDRWRRDNVYFLRLEKTEDTRILQ